MDDETGIIITSVLITLGSGIVVNATKGKAPAFNQFLGAGFMGAFLFGVELINGELAKLLAILIIVGALLRNGDALFGWIAKSSNPPAVTSVASTGTHGVVTA